MKSYPHLRSLSGAQAEAGGERSGKEGRREEKFVLEDEGTRPGDREQHGEDCCGLQEDTDGQDVSHTPGVGLL